VKADTAGGKDKAPAAPAPGQAAAMKAAAF